MTPEQFAALLAYLATLRLAMFGLAHSPELEGNSDVLGLATYVTEIESWVLTQADKTRKKEPEQPAVHH